MSNHSINDLREHLFETLAALRDKDKPMDIDRARAVSEVARQVIESAKVEVEFIKATGGDGSGFIPHAPRPHPLPPPDTAGESNGISGVTRHLLKG